METRNQQNPSRFQIVKLEERIAPTSCLIPCLPSLSVPNVSVGVGVGISTCPVGVSACVSLSLGSCH